MPAFDLDAEEVMEDAVTLSEELIAAGGNEEETAKSVAKFLDGMLPMQLLIPGPAGVIAEAADGPILEQLTKKIMKALRASPEKKAKRMAKQAARRQRRAAKKAAKAGESTDWPV